MDRAVAVLTAAVLVAGMRRAPATPTVAPAPKDPDAPATGTLRFFAYGDTVADEMLDPFREANPDLDLKTASFDSEQGGGGEARRRLRGRRGRGLHRRDAAAARPRVWSGRSTRRRSPASTTSPSRTAPEVRDEKGNVLFVPASAGPQGLIVNTDEIDPEPRRPRGTTCMTTPTRATWRSSRRR